MNYMENISTGQIVACYKTKGSDATVIKIDQNKLDEIIPLIGEKKYDDAKKFIDEVRQKASEQEFQENLKHKMGIFF